MFPDAFKLFYGDLIVSISIDFGTFSPKKRFTRFGFAIMNNARIINLIRLHLEVISMNKMMCAVVTTAALLSTSAYATTITQTFDIEVTSNNVLDGMADPNAFIGSTGTGSISFLAGAAGAFVDALSFSFTLDLDGLVQTFTNADNPFGPAGGFLDSTGARITAIFFALLDDDFGNGNFDVIAAPGIVDFSTIGILPTGQSDIGTVSVEVQTVLPPASVPLPATLPMALFALGAVGAVRKLKNKS
ncbi:MAG: PEP-CTERM sorting domain-containing protein [Paracoccaceae bacterium]